jgi:hypothetical protein
MPKQEKISLEEVKKIPPILLLRMINKAKNYLKKDETWQRICDEYNADADIIDLIPTTFADLEVSGKTDHGVVYLNYKLLCDGDFFEDYAYLIHEFSHFFQQAFGDKPTRGADDGEYLDNPYEIEGFQNQVEYMANELGEDEAEEYVDDLLDHHEIDGKKEKEEKKNELMALVDEK